ncbi:hypothetical protein GGI03_002890 [Coemansia sp. RSA 2337]|nr:hypothetical protein GGI09_008764 [Coemansia sp. S100]KAJ2339339.1 hypothetical protein GGH92_006765 [Coemansia sp. RSA 2673]KAJ2465033.1 hypothetical protein GGI03_002890 [Coemansia sp. RSA 2337]
MSKKPLSVGVSATLNLKAELERARQECKESTSGGSNAAKRPKSSSLALGVGSQNKGVHDRAQRDMQAMDAERLSSPFAHARTRQILEEKAKLYDLLSTTGEGASGLSTSQLDDPRIAQILEEGSVDFVSKQLAHLQRKNGAQEDDTTTGSDLVEIIDEFGRSRMVPRSEARNYRRGSDTTDGSDTSSSSDSGEGLESIARQSRGLGYYNLSHESDRRQDQLKTLQLMHTHTVLTREEAAVSVAERQKQQLTQRQAQLKSCHERFTNTTCK